MAKDPAFLFYPNDYIGGTMGFTFEEKGAYIELLMVQFNRGHMTYDMIEQVLGHKVGQIFGRIKDKFLVDSEGLYYNKRLDEEKIKRQNFTNSRRNNKLGANQYTKKEGNNNGHMTLHMENENVNRLSSIVKENFEKFLKIKKHKLDDIQIDLLAKKLNSFPNDKYRIKSIENSIRAGYPDFYELKEEETNGTVRRGIKYNEEKTKVLMEDGQWEDLTQSEIIIAQADEYHLATQIFRK